MDWLHKKAQGVDADDSTEMDEAREVEYFESLENEPGIEDLNLRDLVYESVSEMKPGMCEGFVLQVPDELLNKAAGMDVSKGTEDQKVTKIAVQTSVPLLGGVYWTVAHNIDGSPILKLEVKDKSYSVVAHRDAGTKKKGGFKVSGWYFCDRYEPNLSVLCDANSKKAKDMAKSPQGPLQVYAFAPEEEVIPTRLHVPYWSNTPCTITVQGTLRMTLDEVSAAHRKNAELQEKVNLLEKQLEDAKKTSKKETKAP